MQVASIRTANGQVQARINYKVPCETAAGWMHMSDADARQCAC